MKRGADRVDEGLSRRPAPPGPERDRSPPQIWPLPSLSGRLRLSTDFGEVPAQLIRVRDRLYCADGRYRPVLRIQAFKFDRAFLDRHPQARPVVIRKNALGDNLPATEVVLSPAQRLLLPSDRSQRTTVSADTFAPPRGSGDPFTGSVTYYAFDVGEATLLQGERIWLASDPG